MGVLQHLHIAKYLFKYSSLLPLPFGVITGAHYTGLNINTAVLEGVNLEFARRIQEIGLGSLRSYFCWLRVDWSGFCEHHRNYLPSSVTRWLPAKLSNRQLPTSPSGAKANSVRRISLYCFCTCWRTISRDMRDCLITILKYAISCTACWNVLDHSVHSTVLICRSGVYRVMAFGNYKMRSAVPHQVPANNLLRESWLNIMLQAVLTSRITLV